MFPAPRFITTNGIRMACYEQGKGPAVVLVHGFPEIAFSWRHQLPALAAAGFSAIAPDMRGYGLSDGPDGVQHYSARELIADLNGLLDALELDSAVFVGHDWGALLLWQMALLEPQRIDGLIILNIPYIPRPSADPIQLMRKKFGDDYYIVNFQDSYAADQLFASDPGHLIDVMMRQDQITRQRFEALPPKMQTLSLLQTFAREESGGRPLLSSEERAVYVDAFERSGFTNPINWYRNWTANWQALEGVDPGIAIPTLFIGAVDDVVVTPAQIERMRPWVEDLQIEMLEPCGHWTQQERPEDVNRLMLEWLGRKMS